MSTSTGELIIDGRVESRGHVLGGCLDRLHVARGNSDSRYGFPTCSVNNATDEPIPISIPVCGVIHVKFIRGSRGIEGMGSEITYRTSLPRDNWWLTLTYIKAE